MTQSHLTVERLVARYVVANDHPDAEALARRLDRVAGLLGSHLATALARYDARQSEGVWLLRSIEVDLGLDTAADEDAMAASWSAAIALALTRRLDVGAQGVVFFEDRAAYLARFLIDLAGGEAWSLWYYGGFDSLRALPLPAALRTAILADAGLGLSALLRLERWSVGRIIDALSPIEAARVLSGLADAPGPRPPATETLLAAWSEIEGAGDPGRLALTFFLAMARIERYAVGAERCALARALATLRLALTQGQVDVLGPLRAGDVAALYRAAGVADGELLAPLIGLPTVVRAALAAIPDASPAGSVARHTRFGGAFLLLPHIADDLPDLPGSDGPDAGALFRLLVLANAAVGEDAASELLLDPVWRDLFAIPGPFLLRDLTEWRAMLPAALIDTAAADVLARFAYRLPGFGGSSAGYLRRNFLSVRARVEMSEDRILVTLSRSPLDLVMGLAGIGRGRILVPWLDPRPIELELEP